MCYKKKISAKCGNKSEKLFIKTQIQIMVIVAKWIIMIKWTNVSIERLICPKMLQRFIEKENETDA